MSAADKISLIAEEIARLCDTLRGTRAYLALCTLFPSSAPGAAARVVEGQLRVQNCLYLLREKRAELINAVEALAA